MLKSITAGQIWIRNKTLYTKDVLSAWNELNTANDLLFKYHPYINYLMNDCALSETGFTDNTTDYPDTCIITDLTTEYDVGRIDFVDVQNTSHANSLTPKLFMALYSRPESLSKAR